jgi:hypothetical protein
MLSRRGDDGALGVRLGVRLGERGMLPGPPFVTGIRAIWNLHWVNRDRCGQA